MAFLKIKNVKIKGISACVPSNFEKSADYSLMTVEEIIKFISSTGIEKRHVAKKSECSSDLCYEAAEKLIADLDWQKDEIGLLVFATHTGDYKIPSTSCLLQHRLGLSKHIMAFDINHGCTGFVYGLSIIANLLNAGSIKKGLLLVGNTQSKNVSFEDKSTYPIFGDAGTATALEFSEDCFDEMEFNFITDAANSQSVYIPDGGYRNPITADSLKVESFEEGIKRNRTHLKMDGADVFSTAIKLVPESINELFSHYGIEKDKVDYLVMHQANKFLCEKIRKKLKIEPEKVPYNFRDFGNSSGASIPLTMLTNLKEELSNKELDLILASIGGGFSIASARVKSKAIYCSDLIYL